MKLFIKYLFIFLMINSNLNAQEWQDLFMPDDTTIFHKMCQVDDYYWAIDYGNGRIFKSTDNAENWKLQFESEGEFLEEIQFLDKDTGYLCGDFGIIMKTLDGGKTWTEIGPDYAHRSTKANRLNEDSAAVLRLYYQMHFKDKDEGLVWAIELPTQKMDWNSRKTFFMQTKDGGNSWEKIGYEEEEYDKITATFISGSKLRREMAMEIYYANGKAYKTGRHAKDGIKISEDDGQNWDNYPLPQLPDRRYILRSIHFINDYQGYIFGGNLGETSKGYIYETLDGGKSWHNLETEFPHIHYSLQKGNEILLAGKDGLLKKWTPTQKEAKRFMHKGNTSKILIDGQIEKREWRGANKESIKPGIDLYMLHDEHYLYLSVQYDTSLYANYYCDLYFDLGNDTLLNIHASQQLGERILTGTEWTDSDSPFDWGNIAGWTANTILRDKKSKGYLPYTALEFQISKKKLINDHIKLALQSRDLNWEKEIINVPEGGDFKSSKDWLMFYFD